MTTRAATLPRLQRALAAASLAAFSVAFAPAVMAQAYPTKPLAYFAPMLREVFGRKAFDPAVIQGAD